MPKYFTYNIFLATSRTSSRNILHTIFSFTKILNTQYFFLNIKTITSKTFYTPFPNINLDRESRQSVPNYCTYNIFRARLFYTSEYLTCNIFLAIHQYNHWWNTWIRYLSCHNNLHQEIAAEIFYLHYFSCRIDLHQDNQCRYTLHTIFVLPYRFTSRQSVPKYFTYNIFLAILNYESLPKYFTYTILPYRCTSRQSMPIYFTFNIFLAISNYESYIMPKYFAYNIFLQENIVHTICFFLNIKTITSGTFYTPFPYINLDRESRQSVPKYCTYCTIFFCQIILHFSCHTSIQSLMKYFNTIFFLP